MFRFWADSTAIKRNNIDPSISLPVIAVEKDGQRQVSVHEIKILGPARMLYRRAARPEVWIETDSEVEFSY